MQTKTLYTSNAGISLFKKGTWTKTKFEKKYAWLPVISVVSSLSTYFLSHDLQLGAVIAASIIGLVAGFLFKDSLFAVGSYSAAFMGMVSKAVIPQWYYLIPAGLIHAIVVIAMLKIFVGWGGKAGTMALISVIANSLVIYFLVPVNYYSADPLGKIAATTAELWGVGLIAGIAGIMLTIVLREKALNKLKRNDAVIGSAIIALLGGIAAFILKGAPFNYANATFIGATIASGTYAGMASRKILPKLYDFLAVGIILGILNVALVPILPGFGGRLGTIGLISCAIWILIIKLRKPKTTAAP
jgi:hypothetical protein